MLSESNMSVAEQVWAKHDIVREHRYCKGKRGGGVKGVICSRLDPRRDRRSEGSRSWLMIDVSFMMEDARMIIWWLPRDLKL